MNTAKTLALILAVAVIVNFLGLVFRLIKPQTFWLVTIVAAITTYWIIPKLRKENKSA